MAHDEVLAAVIQERLLLMQAIDDAAELSFMESAELRLALFGIMRQFDTGATNAKETLKALNQLQKRVEGVVRRES